VSPSPHRKHYREYLVSLINGSSVDPAPLFNGNELVLACRRYQVEDVRSDGEDDFGYYNRLLEVGGHWCHLAAE